MSDPHPSYAALDALSAEEIVRRMSAEDAKVAAVVAARAPFIARAIDAIARRLRAGGRLVYVGAGSSGRLGVLDAAECPATFGTDPAQVVGVIAGGPAALSRPVAAVEDSAEDGRRDLAALEVGADDAVVGITASGGTPYVLGALGHARARGAWVGALCARAEHHLSEEADLVIAVDVGPEVLTDSTRLKAGTATKMVLNMLSTGAMVRSGRTFENLMVEAPPLSDKLRARARRIVAGLTGLPPAETQALLDECGGEVKAAVVVHCRAVTAAVARRLLAGAQGRLREVLQDGGRPDHAAAARHGRDPGALVVGIDAGGTKTLALLAPAAVSGEVVGRGLAGPGNVAEGFDRAAAAIGAAVDAARAEAGCREGPFAAACLAVAGAGAEEGRQSLERWARRLNLAHQLLIVHDAYPVLACGAPEGPGVALIAGTGSIAFGRNAGGETARAGGWGWLVGDGGGGCEIGTAALRAVARAADGRGPDTRLTERLLALFRVHEVRSIITALHDSGFAPSRVARLAWEVADAAQAGDPVARDILAAAADHLSEITAAVVHRLGLRPGAFPLALAGGVLLNAPLTRHLLNEALVGRGVAPNRVVPVEEPAQGSILLARHCLLPA